MLVVSWTSIAPPSTITASWSTSGIGSAAGRQTSSVPPRALIGSANTPGPASSCCTIASTRMRAVCLSPCAREVRPGHLRHGDDAEPLRARPDGRGARLRIALFHRAHPHPGEPRDALPTGRRSAARVLASVRSVRLVHRSRGRYRAAQGSHGDLPGGATRSDHDRQGGGKRRPAERWAIPVRRGGGVEPGGDAQPRHRPVEAVRTPARAGGGDEGDLDSGRARVPRPPRGLRPHLVMAQAGAGAPSSGSPRRPRSQGGRPRARVCRRVVPQQLRRHRQDDRADRADEAPGARGGGTRDRRHPPDRPARAAGIERYEAAGVHRCVWYLPSAAPDQVERALDMYANVVRAYSP